jgi:hypothetical protein
MTKQANTSEKSKELQPTAQSQRFEVYLLLPQPHCNLENLQNLIYQ